MTQSKGSRPVVVWVLIALHLLLGIGGVPSGAMLVAAPDGRLLGMPVSMLEHSPFTDFAIPGLILLFLLGVYPLFVAYGLWRRPVWRWPEAFNPFRKLHWAWAASLAGGVVLFIWIVVEMVLLRAVAFLHVLYFVWSVAILALTLLPAVRRHYRRDIRQD